MVISTLLPDFAKGLILGKFALDNIGSELYNTIMNDEMLTLIKLLMRSGKAVEAKLDGTLDDVALSTTRLLTLRQIAHSDEPLSLGQLATCLAFVKSNATQLVDRLEVDSLVQRVPAAYDRRCTLLALTEAGQARYAEALQLVEPLVTRLEQTFTSDERAQLANLLTRWSEALQ